MSQSPDLSHIAEDLRPLAVPIDSIYLDPANARVDHDIDGIAGSLSAYGQLTPVVVNRSEGDIVKKGNGTYRGARRLGWTHIAAVFVEFDNMTATGYAIADNRLGDKSRFERDILLSLMAKLDELDEPPPTGFGPGEVDELAAQLAREYPPDPPPEGEADAEPQTTRAEEVRREWGTEVGQLWRLPSNSPDFYHLVICGDSRETAVVERLLEGNGRPRYGLHDPPYGIDVVSVSDNGIGGDKAFGSAEARRTGKIGSTGVVETNVYSPVIGDDKPFDPAQVLEASEFKVLWGGNYYADKLPPVKGWIVWDKKGREEWRDNFSDCELAWSDLPIVTRIIRHTWLGMIQEGERERRYHPNQKPVLMYQKVMREVFKDPGTVLDLYAGVGPTLIAAENLGRPSRLAELDPAYVAVILQRYKDAFGLEPELLK